MYQCQTPTVHERKNGKAIVSVVENNASTQYIDQFNFYLFLLVFFFKIFLVTSLCLLDIVVSFGSFFFYFYHVMEAFFNFPVIVNNFIGLHLSFKSRGSL